MTLHLMHNRTRLCTSTSFGGNARVRLKNPLWTKNLEEARPLRF